MEKTLTPISHRKILRQILRTECGLTEIHALINKIEMKASITLMLVGAGFASGFVLGDRSRFINEKRYAGNDLQFKHEIVLKLPDGSPVRSYVVAKMGEDALTIDLVRRSWLAPMLIGSESLARMEEQRNSAALYLKGRGVVLESIPH